MAIVYVHRRSSTNEIFYVGVGKDMERPFEKIGRKVRKGKIMSTIIKKNEKRRCNNL
jgi:hypothetical protein